MNQKERKLLAEVDVPIAAVPPRSARGMLIGLDQPFTLHLAPLLEVGVAAGSADVERVHPFPYTMTPRAIGRLARFECRPVRR